MRLEETFQQLRAIPWLDYTFVLGNEYIDARGANNIRFHLCKDHFATFDGGTRSHHHIRQMVGMLVAQSRPGIIKSYIKWALAFDKINVIWHYKFRGIVTREQHTFGIKITRGAVVISCGTDREISIVSLFSYTIGTLFPLPTNTPPGASEEAYERMFAIMQQYKRECPFMSAKYHCSFGQETVTIAGAYVRSCNDVSYKRILHWERELALKDTIKALPQPIAEEIAPHLL